MSTQFRVAKLLPERLREQGIPADAVLRAAGLPSDLFRQERATISTEELFSLWRAIGEVSDDPVIGLKLGVEPRFEKLRPTAIAALCSRSFRDALQRVARYKRLTCPEDIRVRTLGGEAFVEVVYLEADEIQPDTLVDLVTAWIAGIARQGSDGKIVPLRLELTRSEKHRKPLEAHFGCRVRFDARRNALVFRTADLDKPFVTHNEDLLAPIGAHLEAELRAQAGEESLETRVKHSLRRSLAGRRPALRDVAEELGLSTRTLQRRLSDAAISFQQVVEATRRELAHHYLRQDGVELKETAFLLGYEDVHSFFRAFQEWEGTTPGAWRSRHLPAKVSRI